jgi:hypothetical protein
MGNDAINTAECSNTIWEIQQEKMRNAATIMGNAAINNEQSSIKIGNAARKNEECSDKYWAMQGNEAITGIWGMTQ